MTPEVVSVPTKGIERWLSQRLSAQLGVTPGAHDGVCANIDFPFPGTLVSTALARATGNDPKADPWLPERAVWPLMEVVEEHFDEPWLAPLADHIRNSGVTEEEALPGTTERTKRFSIVRHVADLFDRYAVHRPTCFSAGRPGRRNPTRRPGSSSCGGCSANASAVPSPAEHLESACRRLREDVRPPRPPSTVLVVRADTAARELPGRPRRRRLSARRQSLPPPPVPRALEPLGSASGPGHQAFATSGGPDGVGSAQSVARLVGPRRPARCSSSSAVPRPTPRW